MQDQIAVSKFFRECKTRPQDFEGAYPTEDALIQAVAKNFHMFRDGYRDGVILVPIPPRFMRTRVVMMTPEMRMRTTFESRVPGETPRRKTVAVVSDLPLARSASAVVYRADVLAEDDDRSSDKPWEIVTVLAHAGLDPEPMTVGTLLANHFQFSGGTRTLMSDSEFVNALRVSAEFWKDHCLAELRDAHPKVSESVETQ